MWVQSMGMFSKRGVKFVSESFLRHQMTVVISAGLINPYVCSATVSTPFVVKSCKFYIYSFL